MWDFSDMARMIALAPATNRSIRAHPSGLWILVGTELWERISFHGMQALLTLYMAEQLFRSGHVEHIRGFQAYRSLIESITGPLSVRALAAQTFGLYIGLVFFTPLLGGWTGDRVIGRRACVLLGALLLTGGHFAMAFDASFLLALALLILGAGLLRGNLRPQVTTLYAEGDPRQADAFQIYYVAVNTGAFIAPILTGLIAVTYGWHFAFGFAGVGMLIGLALYLAGSRWLPEDRSAVRGRAVTTLSMHDRRSILGLCLLLPVAITFWIAQTQIWNVYNLWLRDHVNLLILGWRVPVPWLQALDGISPVLVMPLLLTWWKRQAAHGREPDDLGKIARGCLIFGGGTALLSVASYTLGTGRAPIGWSLAFHLISNAGWLFFTPTMDALFARQSPVSIRGTLMGVNLLTVFFASLISGRLGGYYESWQPGTFWLVHAGLVCAGGLVVLAMAPLLRVLFVGSARAAVR